MAVAHTVSDSLTANGEDTALPGFSITPSGSERLMRVAVSWFDNDNSRTISTLTVGGSSITANLRTTLYFASNTRKLAVYYMIAPAASSLAIAGTLSASADDRVVGVSCYSGVHQTVPFGTVDTEDSSVSTSATPNIVLSGGDANGLCVAEGVFFAASISSFSHDQRWYEPEWQGNGKSIACQTTAGSGATLQFNLGSAVHYGIIGDLILPAGASGSTVPVKMGRYRTRRNT